MEETKTEKPSYEQLENMAMKLKNRCMMLESRLASIDLTTTRLNYLFKVVNNASTFPAEFVTGIINEIVEFLEIKEEPENCKPTE